MTYPFRILDNLRVEILIDNEWKKFGQAAHYHLYSHLGYKSKLPDEGFPETYVGNVKLWCLPKTPGKPQDAARIWCECPNCGKRLTFGKLQQHRKVHRQEGR